MRHLITFFLVASSMLLLIASTYTQQGIIFAALVISNTMILITLLLLALAQKYRWKISHLASILSVSSLIAIPILVAFSRTFGWIR